MTKRLLDWLIEDRDELDQFDLCDDHITKLTVNRKLIINQLLFELTEHDLVEMLTYDEYNEFLKNHE